MSIFKNILVLLSVTFALSEKDFPNTLSDEYNNFIISQKNLLAGYNYTEDILLEFLVRSGTILIDIPDGSTIITHEDEVIASLPESFDAREKWPYCPSLFEIRDQGWCGSCWAYGAVEAMTDRWCIHSDGLQQFHFSAQDLLACASGKGCHGGDIATAWDFWYTDGIVSGGNYNSYEDCKPYEPAPCNSQICPQYPKTPCIQKCQADYLVPYHEDKRYGQVPYFVNGEEHIMAELYLNGPLEVRFIACPDLYKYTDTIYYTRMDLNHCPKGHAVKVIGWGVEKGMKYWLLANSWGSGWGQLGGYFKFLRGVNHLDIETGAIAGIPDYRIRDIL